MNCIVIDDEQYSINILKDYSEKVPFLNIVYATTNPVDGYNYILNNEVDLIFLDIHMPDKLYSGFDLVKMINDKNKIILTTGDPTFAVEAFKYNVNNYLLKPFSFDRFFLAINNIYNPKIYKDVIFIKSEGKKIAIVVNNIVIIEALQNYINFYTIDKKFTCNYSLAEISKLLDPNSFIRVHRSFIISKKYIDYINGNDIYMQLNNIFKLPVPIGNSYKDSFLKYVKEIN